MRRHPPGDAPAMMDLTPRLGLRGQLMCVLAGALALITGLLGLQWHNEDGALAALRRETAQAERHIAGDRLQAQGLAEAEALARKLAPAIAAGDRAGIAAATSRARAAQGVVYVIAFDAAGHILEAGKAAPAGMEMDDPMARAVLRADRPFAQWNGDQLDLSAPALLDGLRVGGVRVGRVLGDASVPELAPLRDQLEASRRAQGRRLVALLLGMAALAALAVWLMQRHVVAPIRRLAAAVEAMGPGKELVLAPSERERFDEIGALGRAFAHISAGLLRHDREIRRMAYTDPLTGLANRLSFRESLDDRLLTLQASSGELALLFIDLDDFKRVNDTLGHEAGDEVLAQLSMRVRLTLEQCEAHGFEIARFGGDEFIVLYLADDIRAASARLAEALIAEVARPLLLHGKQVFLGASVGITLFPFDATHAGQLLKNADIAMYQAKVAGKNCYRFYSRAMDQAVERRVQLEHDLRGAWDRGEMSVAYQPLFQLADGRLTGAEALLRWQHPELGMVPPSVFIEVAEQAGLIEALGRRVLERACLDAAQWTVAGKPRPFISVNISPRQLRSGELPDVVGHALRSSGLLPEQLHLELTETAVLSDESQASALLTRVRGTGVKVWLDDFGTGFSGLSHLRRVPVDGVKIDRSFVADVLRDPDDLALTSAIIAMAHSLGITVVAEGIETEGQYAILRERGCDQGQGFWLGRPMPAEELGKKFREP
jgi:diguanylate cyclase (GGDEF)-like protein